MAAKSGDVIEHGFRAMGTDVQVLLHGGAEEAANIAQKRIDELERKWSRFLPDSEISQLNRSQGALTVVSGETFALLRSAVEAWMLTEGRFDPTVEAAMLAAGYTKDFPELPTPVVHPILGEQRAPTPEGIALDPATNAVFLPAGVTVDLGGIGKGQAADIVTAELIEHGVAGCVVNIGGDLRTRGQPPTTEGWEVTLECPGSNEVRQIRIQSGAVCTSTKSKRMWNGPKGLEHHIRDPKTGRRAETGLAAVSVICAGALQGEVLSKSAFLLGRSSAPEMLSNHDVTGLLVGDDGTIIELDGLSLFLDHQGGQ